MPHIQFQGQNQSLVISNPPPLIEDTRSPNLDFKKRLKLNTLSFVTLLPPTIDPEALPST